MRAAFLFEVYILQNVRVYEAFLISIKKTRRKQKRPNRKESMQNSLPSSTRLEKGKGSPSRVRSVTRVIFYTTAVLKTCVWEKKKERRRKRTGWRCAAKINFSAKKHVVTLNFP